VRQRYRELRIFPYQLPADRHYSHIMKAYGGALVAAAIASLLAPVARVQRADFVAIDSMVRAQLAETRIPGAALERGANDDGEATRARERTPGITTAHRSRVGVAVALPFLQIIAIIRTVKRWHSGVTPVPRRGRRRVVGSVVGALWGLFILAGLPVLFQSYWATMTAYQPDFAIPLLVSGVLGLVWSVVRTVSGALPRASDSGAALVA
jgi:hypothetical protein